jgi:hypothetical protein
VPAEASRRQALESVISHLRCPVCARPVRLAGPQLICDNGHNFDIARQGYVNLTAGRANRGTADTAGMIAARERFQQQRARGSRQGTAGPPRVKGVAAGARGCYFKFCLA